MSAQSSRGPSSIFKGWSFTSRISAGLDRALYVHSADFESSTSIQGVSAVFMCDMAEDSISSYLPFASLELKSFVLASTAKLGRAALKVITRLL